MHIEAHGQAGGDPTQFCERLLILAADWSEGPDLAAIFVALQQPGGKERLAREARLIIERKERWTPGLLIPSRN